MIYNIKNVYYVRFTRKLIEYDYYKYSKFKIFVDSGNLILEIKGKSKQFSCLREIDIIEKKKFMYNNFNVNDDILYKQKRIYTENDYYEHQMNGEINEDTRNTKIHKKMIKTILHEQIDSESESEDEDDEYLINMLEDKNLEEGLMLYLKYGTELNEEFINNLMENINDMITFKPDYKIATYILNNEIGEIIPKETEEPSILLEKWYILTMLLKKGITDANIENCILKIDKLYSLYKNKQDRFKELFNGGNNIYILKDVINEDELDKIFLLTNNRNDKTRLIYYVKKILKHENYYTEKGDLEGVCKERCIDFCILIKLFDKIPLINRENGKKKDVYLYKDYCKYETNIKKFIERMLIGNKISTHVKTHERLKGKQIECYNNAINNKLSIISGLPGAGKSETTAYICKYLMDNGYDLRIMAPTGLAKSKLENGIMKIAKTPEKMMSGTIDYFNVQLRTKNKYADKNERDVGKKKITIIIDEFSMVSIKLFSNLIENLGTLNIEKMILIGDTNQLPSIDTGSLLHELVNYGNTKKEKIDGENVYYTNEENVNRIIPNVELCEILRTGDDKELAEIFQKIVDKNLDVECKIKMLKNSKSVNFVNYKMGIENKIIIETVGEYNKNDENDGAKIRDIKEKNRDLVFLTSTRKNADNVNKLVRKQLYGKNYYKDFNVKDRIMCTKNGKYGGELMNNGNIYYILNKNLINKKFTYEIIRETDLDKMRTIKISELEIKKFIYAYCLTIHKSQSCEWENVIVILENNGMLTRNLLYTGITRTKTKCTLITTESTLRKCLLNEADKLNTYIPHRFLNHKCN
jgi:hypothetical protein